MFLKTELFIILGYVYFKYRYADPYTYIIHKWTDILGEYIFLVIFLLIITYAGPVFSYIFTVRWIEFDLNECLKITKSILNQAFSK